MKKIYVFRSLFENDTYGTYIQECVCFAKREDAMKKLSDWVEENKNGWDKDEREIHLDDGWARFTNYSNIRDYAEVVESELR